jgi:hypothetical protein
MSPSIEPADMKMFVTILHACPLAVVEGTSCVPLVWREHGFEEMKNAMNRFINKSKNSLKLYSQFPNYKKLQNSSLALALWRLLS